jgi:hypothetical protein
MDREIDDKTNKNFSSKTNWTWRKLVWKILLEGKLATGDRYRIYIVDLN